MIFESFIIFESAVKAIALLIIAIISLLFYVFKHFKARQVIGKNIDVRPFRQDSIFDNLILIEPTITGIIRQKEGDYWNKVTSKQTISINNQIYDYLLIQPKKADDNLSIRKPVICDV